MPERSTPPRPPALYWVCQASGWGAFFLLNFFTSKGFITPSWQLTSGYALLSVSGILLSHGFRSFLLRRGWLELPISRLLPRVVGVNLLLAVILVAIVTVFFIFVPPRGGTGFDHGPAAYRAALVIFTFNDFIIFTLWSGIYFGVAFSKRQRRMEIERYQAQAALAEAELRGLKSQLNPHFLFNSLNSLRALVVEDPTRAQEAITQLAGILRYHLQSGERALVPLREEIETVDRYLALELIRFEDRLTVERAIDEGTLACLVPPLALQTLVENAVKYGVSRETSRAVIQLTACLQADRIVISVKNTGTLRRDSPNESTSLGLANLRTRLRLLFAERATFALHETEPGWVEAQLELPVTNA
ncbi:MAG: sensor histidine kinase [Chthoniobacterales bacterium]